MDGGTRARVEEEKALDSSRLRSSVRLGFASSSSAGSSRIARRKRKKRRRQQQRNSNVDDEDELVVVGGSGGSAGGGAGAGAGGGGGGGDGGGGGRGGDGDDDDEEISTLGGPVVTILAIKEEQQQQQSAGQTTVSSEEPGRQPKNRLSHTDESQRNVTRGGSGSRAAASSLSSGNTLLNRRAVGKRSSRRCNANARRNAMTMDLQRLITEVHARPAIWDQKNVNYHNRDVILKMWREIARACEVSTDVAKSKWKHLRDNFRNELKKTYRGKCDGGTNEHDSKWVWFKSLFFLRDQMNSRVIGCTLSQNCSAALRSSPDGTQIEPQIDILEGHEETPFDDLDGDSCQSLLSNDDGLHQVMPPPKISKIGRKRSLMDAMDSNYSEVDRKRFESLQKRLSISQEEEDDTYHFLMSVRNPLKSLPLDRQMFVRLKIQELVYNEINSQNQQNRSYDVSQDVKPLRTRNAIGAPGGGEVGLSESVRGVDTNVDDEAPGGGGGGRSGDGGSDGGAGVDGGQTVNDISNHPASLLQNCTTEGSSDDTFFVSCRSQLFSLLVES
ncbi:unnamed protein product [Xylocopa violacea]|uniref:MADF domain-containing protein n=1 Tax=Xylocopa violacea TaxID=135666 RepID=A0ABP1NP96_XYLVO